jgi:hypothetical protein
MSLRKGSYSALSAGFRRIDDFIDIVLIFLITALSFGLAYHPYFFGDEVVFHNLVIGRGYSFWSIFQEINSYKPRLFFHTVEVLLAKWQASRLIHAVIVVGCMVWINILLYYVVRNLFNGSRLLALLLVAVVLTSRYGTMFYFDYIAGAIELMSTALLLSSILLAWIAWRDDFNRWCAATALLVAILCIFTHERYVAGLIAVGIAIAIAEWTGSLAKRRIPVLVWAWALPSIPLVLFLTANTALGSLSIATGTAGQQVKVGGDTLWCALTYCYNVFLGGNYGHEWLWGHYNYLHPIGKTLGWATAACTMVMAMLAFARNGIAWGNSRIGASFMAIALALIAVASLTGSGRQEARFMAPVGILVAMIWIVMLKNTWRYIAVTLILMTNATYLLLGSYDSIYSVYSSRAASSIASSLLGVKPSGGNALVVGNPDDYWVISGSDFGDKGPRNGRAFSKVNLRPEYQIDAFRAGSMLDSKIYDFGLAFDGFGPRRVARYRLVSVDTAFILAGVASADKLPIKSILASGDAWLGWQWSMPPDYVTGVVKLGPGMAGWLSVPVPDLDGRWLVYQARTTTEIRVPMRLQVNWHTKQNNRFVSTTIKVVYPSEKWQSYATLLKAPPDAEIGYVYANLHDGAQAEVELKSIDLR